MKKPKREKLYQELCKYAGLTPRKKFNHISRKEMVELLLCMLEKVGESCRQKRK
jgi:hypothetical protein